MDPNRRRALDHTIRPTRAEVDLDALRHNLAQARSLAGQAKVLAVVKANAYGHGAVPVALALEEAGVEMLGVALVEEGLELRNAGVKAPILVLGGSYEGGYELMVAYDLVPTLFRKEHLAHLSAAAAAQGKAQVKAHLKVDTGMGRIGVAMDGLGEFVEQLRAYPNLLIDGLLSHFASADLSDPGQLPAPPGGGSATRAQVARFASAIELLKAKGHQPSWRHLANSAGVMDVPEVRDGLAINLVRPGIMLYGLSPAGWLSQRAQLRPVLSWKTAITHLKEVPAGTAVSYGGTWVASRPSLIATLPVGYADGYSRSYSSRAPVLVRGVRAPIAGRVCMDMCLIDVTGVEGVQVGDEAVLLGEQGTGRIGAEELALLGGTIHYEVLCGVGARVPRVTRETLGGRTEPS